jgi:steroid Delta-isomerase
MASSSNNPETVRAVVDQYVNASNANDKAQVLSLFAPDAVWHDPVGQPPHVGIDAISEFFDQTRSMADRIEMKPSDVIVCGAEAVMVFEIHVTLGDGGMVMDAVETFEIDDHGRISGMKAYWDMTRARPSTA